MQVNIIFQPTTANNINCIYPTAVRQGDKKYDLKKVANSPFEKLLNKSQL